MPRVQCNIYDSDVIAWKRFPHYWTFVKGIQRSPVVNSSYKVLKKNCFDVFPRCSWTNWSPTIWDTMTHMLCHCHVTFPQTKGINLNRDVVIKWKHFRVTGPLCGEFIGHWWIPLTKASGVELLVFSLICAWTNGWVNNRYAGDLRRHRAHWCVTVMISSLLQVPLTTGYNPAQGVAPGGAVTAGDPDVRPSVPLVPEQNYTDPPQPGIQQPWQWGAAGACAQPHVPNAPPAPTAPPFEPHDEPPSYESLGFTSETKH